MHEENLIKQRNPLWLRFLLTAGVLLLGINAATLWVRLQIPEGSRIPMHWNARGEVDGWGGPGSLWLMPLIMFGMMALFAVLPKLEPRRGTALLKSKAYLITGLASLFVMASVQVGILFAAQGKEFPMLPVVFTLIGLLFVVIGNYLGKVRSNFVMGIRTPWTLSSELSWNKTHRLGGRLFALLGLVWIFAAWLGFPETAILWILIGGVFLLVGVTMVYSYLVWKSDPDRSQKNPSATH